jgi:deazaflavin-dependent oxidoreductase (nitroreductase family)
LRTVNRVVNPLTIKVARFLPGQAVIETTGRKSGLPRRTPVGGKLEDGSFWVVTEHGRYANYVRNIEHNPRVRVQVRGQWRPGTAHLMDDDDPKARLRKLPAHNSAVVRMLGTNLLTLRIDLD